MQLPRKGILIRIVVYGGLIGFLGWRALSPHAIEPAKDQDEVKRLQELRRHSRTVTLPDGETQVIYEITPEQAERLFGVRPEVSSATKQGGSAKAAGQVQSTGAEPPAAAENVDPGDADATSSESGDDASTASH